LTISVILKDENLSAEEEGFEPPEALTPQRFSRPPQSTTLPFLRCKIIKILLLENEVTVLIVYFFWHLVYLPEPNTDNFKNLTVF
jgi:hypothetical protein